LGGPCPNLKAHNDADHWFIRASRHASVYCSHRCALNVAKMNERQRSYDEKISRAQKAIGNYARRPLNFKNLTWQEYVVWQESSLTKRFLTTAVSAGRLTPP
jgi:hypothetical protein